MTGLLPKEHKTTGAKTGQPEKAEDNGQATEATKPATLPETNRLPGGQHALRNKPKNQSQR